MRKLRIIMIALVIGTLGFGLSIDTLAHDTGAPHSHPDMTGVEYSKDHPAGELASVGAGGGDAEGGKEGKTTEKGRGILLDLMSPEWGPAVWNLVVFLLALTILSLVVWPKILNGLRAREDKIREDLTTAETKAKEATAKAVEYETKLAEAAQEAHKIVEQARADAETLKAKLTADTEAEINKMKTRATEEIKLAQQQAVQELYAQTAQLATAVAGKLIQREITAADTEQLVQATATELEKKAG